jgi:hypothetical protein
VESSALKLANQQEAEDEEETSESFPELQGEGIQIVYTPNITKTL